MTIQYSQFSTLPRAVSQVAKRLSIMVDASRSGQAACVSAARKRAMAAASSSDAAMPATWPRHDSSEIRAVPSCDQRRKPKTATPTYQTCSRLHRQTRAFRQPDVNERPDSARDPAPAAARQGEHHVDEA